MASTSETGQLYLPLFYWTIIIINNQSTVYIRMYLPLFYWIIISRYLQNGRLHVVLTLILLDYLQVNNNIFDEL